MNKKSISKKMIDQLKTDIETAINRKVSTPKDFGFLRDSIFARLHVWVGRSTLMRLWNYIDNKVEPRESTLDVLSQYLGYKDWEEYKQNALLPKEQQSSPVLCRKLSVLGDLAIGDGVRLTWQPGRVCDIEYLGDLKFRVVESEKTRLHKDDTFQCSLIVDGEPLYLDNLIQDDRPPVAYICGMQSGVRFEHLP